MRFGIASIDAGSGRARLRLAQFASSATARSELCRCNPACHQRAVEPLLAAAMTAIAGAGGCHGADAGYRQQKLFLLVVPSVDSAAHGSHSVRGGGDPAL